MRNIAVGSEVIFVAPPATDKGTQSFKKGIIIEVFSQGAARLDLTPRTDKGEAVDPDKAPLGHHTALAEYSAEGEIGTFHFPDETKAVKAAAAEAAPASNNSTGGTK